MSSMIDERSVEVPIMVYQIWIPQHVALRPYVQCFWHINQTIPYAVEKILPTGTVELIINFGGAFRTRTDTGHDLHTRSWLVGLQTRYVVNEVLADSHMVGIRFHPGGSYPFIRYDAHEFHNKIIAMDSIWQRSIHELREQLYEAQTATARFQLLETFLLSRLRDHEPPASYIQHAVQSLAASSGMQPIQQLANQIGISQKHFGNQFKKIVGVTPKSLARIYRFQQVLRHVNPTQAVDWAAVAHHCHYHDQSHFNKDFTAFTGETPTNYVKLLQPYIENSGNESAHFVPIG
ncbi:MAG: AraC family transcriptional regulator [Anaerolineae bacterium]|nr:AraC family transcriptional regulator [Anaerolineae bacterium]